MRPPKGQPTAQCHRNPPPPQTEESKSNRGQQCDCATNEPPHRVVSPLDSIKAEHFMHGV
jgi:hypothetical protein